MNTDINIYAAVIQHFHVFGVFLLGRTMIFASHLGLSLFSCHFVAWAWLVISFEQSPGRLFEYCRMPINIAYSCKWNCAVQSVLFYYFFKWVIISHLGHAFHQRVWRMQNEMLGAFLVFGEILQNMYWKTSRTWKYVATTWRRWLNDYFIGEPNTI